MATATVDLKSFIVSNQTFGGPAGDEMTGVVMFDLTVDGKTAGYSVPVKLVVGGKYEVDSVEVGSPAGYRGPFNQTSFAECVQKYVHGAVGTKGWAIRTGPGARVSVTNCVFSRPMRCSFEVSGDSGAW